MNYKAELRGFAFDRALRLAEINKHSQSFGEIQETADKLVDYLYIADKDIKAHLDTLFPLLAQERNIPLMKDIALNLEQMIAEIEAEQDKINKANESNLPILTVANSKEVN